MVSSSRRDAGSPAGNSAAEGGAATAGGGSNADGLRGAGVCGGGVVGTTAGGATVGDTAGAGRLFAAPPKPSHEVNSSQPERRFGVSAGVLGTAAGGVGGAAAAGGCGRVGRCGGATGSAPNSLANSSQRLVCFSPSDIVILYGCKPGYDRGGNRPPAGARTGDYRRCRQGCEVVTAQELALRSVPSTNATGLPVRRRFLLQYRGSPGHGRFGCSVPTPPFAPERGRRDEAADADNEP